jgi:hypothetical protein
MAQGLQTQINDAEAGIRRLLEGNEYLQALRQLGGLRRLYDQHREDLDGDDRVNADQRIIQIDHATQALKDHGYATTQSSQEDYLAGSQGAIGISEEERVQELARADVAPTRTRLDTMKETAKQTITRFQESLYKK